MDLKVPAKKLALTLSCKKYSENMSTNSKAKKESSNPKIPQSISNLQSIKVTTTFKSLLPIMNTMIHTSFKVSSNKLPRRKAWKFLKMLKISKF